MASLTTGMLIKLMFAICFTVVKFGARASAYLLNQITLLQKKMIRLVHRAFYHYSNFQIFLHVFTSTQVCYVNFNVQDFS